MEKIAYIFPGQGTQFVGMAKHLLGQESWKAEIARKMLEKSDKILGFNILDLMSIGEEEYLCQTNICQPAVFLYSTILYIILEKEQFFKKPYMVAGHSLGEISALVAAKTLTFEEGLEIVIIRSRAMQKACEKNPPSTMAAVIGLEDKIIEKILCSIKEDVVVPANYNSLGQIVISGTIRGINIASQKLKDAGAKIIVPLKVQGAFHSPLMESARNELSEIIRKKAKFRRPICPIYQNIDGRPSSDSVAIRKKLVAQITNPVRWHQTILNMVSDGATSFIEIGPGNVLQNLVRRIVPKNISVSTITSY